MHFIAIGDRYARVDHIGERYVQSRGISCNLFRIVARVDFGNFHQIVDGQRRCAVVLFQFPVVEFFRQGVDKAGVISEQIDHIGKRHSRKIIAQGRNIQNGFDPVDPGNEVGERVEIRRSDQRVEIVDQVHQILHVAVAQIFEQLREIFIVFAEDQIEERVDVDKIDHFVDRQNIGVVFEHSFRQIRKAAPIANRSEQFGKLRRADRNRHGTVGSRAFLALHDRPCRGIRTVGKDRQGKYGQDHDRGKDDNKDFFENFHRCDLAS